jgi:hypothetical protein
MDRCLAISKKEERIKTSAYDCLQAFRWNAETPHSSIIQSAEAIGKEPNYLIVLLIIC